jgi:putative transposase
MARVTAHRTRQIDHDLHTASRRLIDLLVAEGLGTLIIGQNPLWKQAVTLGRRTTQQLVGIGVLVTEERSTSTASFLDGDPLPVYDESRRELPVLSGRRVKRGLYQAARGRRLNADGNGAYTIIRKTLPDALHQGIAGAAVHPTRLAMRTQGAA